jgi:benzylsuccinate CoA-transferase BbsF subunit
MPTRCGNDDPADAPHGVYPGVVPDSWIAIACQNDEQWASLATEMRRGDLAGLSFDERRSRRDELDALIGEWTARQDPAGLQHRLQAHGVPAHHVQNSGQCLNDPQLQHLGHYSWLPHPEARRVLVDNVPYRMSRSAGGYAWGGPTYGQHTMEVLGDLLGYDADHIADLAAAEALE